MTGWPGATVRGGFGVPTRGIGKVSPSVLVSPHGVRSRPLSRVSECEVPVRFAFLPVRVYLFSQVVSDDFTFS